MRFYLLVLNASVHAFFISNFNEIGNYVYGKLAPNFYYYYFYIIYFWVKPFMQKSINKSVKIHKSFDPGRRKRAKNDVAYSSHALPDIPHRQYDQGTFGRPHRRRRRLYKNLRQHLRKTPFRQTPCFPEKYARRVKKRKKEKKADLKTE